MKELFENSSRDLPGVQSSGLSASTAGVPGFNPWSESYDPASHMVRPKKLKNSPG